MRPAILVQLRLIQPTFDAIALAGFLAPGAGGSVLYTLKPKKGLPTGTVVNNQASIVFDLNPAMTTSTWFNTLDNASPLSQVLPLAQTQYTTSFTIKWQGTDAGSGLRDFTIYVSDNGGALTSWLEGTAETQATFTGKADHTYAFYSKARDFTGNAEGLKTAPDAMTKIKVIPGDLNGDGKVDCADLAIVKASFGKKCGQTGFDPRADVNKDCVVDIRDLAFVSQKLAAGTKCP